MSGLGLTPEQLLQLVFVSVVLFANLAALSCAVMVLWRTLRDVADELMAIRMQTKLGEEFWTGHIAGSILRSMKEKDPAVFDAPGDCPSDAACNGKATRVDE